MKRRSKSEERDDRSQLMEQQECRYVCQRGINQWRGVALQELGQTRRDTDDSRAGLLGGFRLNVIWLGGESWTLLGSQGKSRSSPASPSGGQPLYPDHDILEFSSSFLEALVMLRKPSELSNNQHCEVRTF